MVMIPYPDTQLMALILHLETATTASSVALSLDGELLAVSERNEKNLHASVITLLIAEVLELAGVSLSRLNAISVSKGPGSYTGLRIGVATAKGLCYALDIPLIGINTLEAMSSGLQGMKTGLTWGKAALPELLCPLIDARRMEVYMALFDPNGNAVRQTSAEIIDEHTFAPLLLTNQVVFFGDGAAKIEQLYPENPRAIFIPDFLNSAAFQPALALAKFNHSVFETLHTFEPFYLKEFFSPQPASKA